MDQDEVLGVPQKFNIEVKKIASTSNFILFIVKDNKVMATGADLHKYGHYNPSQTHNIQIVNSE